MAIISENENKEECIIKMAMEEMKSIMKDEKRRNAK